MTYKGHVEGGQIVLDGKVELPEGTLVRVELLPEQDIPALHPEITRFTGIIPQEVYAVSEHRDRVQNKHS